jgi:hypothetical protein
MARSSLFREIQSQPSYPAENASITIAKPWAARLLIYLIIAQAEASILIKTPDRISERPLRGGLSVCRRAVVVFNLSMMLHYSTSRCGMVSKSQRQPL